MKLTLPDFTKPDTLKSRTDGELFAIIGSWKDPMPSQAGRLSDTHRWNLVNYLRSVSGNVPEKSTGKEPEENIILVPVKYEPRFGCCPRLNRGAGFQPAPEPPRWRRYAQVGTVPRFGCCPRLNPSACFQPAQEPPRWRRYAQVGTVPRFGCCPRLNPSVGFQPTPEPPRWRRYTQIGTVQRFDLPALWSIDAIAGRFVC